MNYRIIDHKKNAVLSPMVKAIYLLSTGGVEESYGCAPNGQVGISIILSGSGYLKVKDTWVKRPAATVYGLVRQVEFHRMSPDFMELNINFEPHVLQSFTNIRLCDMVDNNGIELKDFFSAADTGKFLSCLHAGLEESPLLETIQTFISLIPIQKKDKRVKLAYDLITSNKITKVEELSSILNITSTSVRSLFKEKIGISPKDLIRIHRIRKSLETSVLTEQSLTSLAYNLEYFDQAHFIHDFKTAIGLTPGKYFQNDKLTFDFYNFGRWRGNSFAE